LGHDCVAGRLWPATLGGIHGYGDGRCGCYPYDAASVALSVRFGRFFHAVWGAAINEVIIGGVFLALTLTALITTPFFARRAWGWLLPALASLPPVAFYMWLVFWFRIIF